MATARWSKYPENQPEESGVYVVNWRINNVYMTVLSFFDRNTKKWYNCNDRDQLLEGIKAFNPFKIVPNF